MPLLTISIPAHNKSFLIEEAIASIISEPEFSKEVNITISDNSLNNDIRDLYDKKYSMNKSIEIFDSKAFKCLDSNVNRAVNIASGELISVEEIAKTVGGEITFLPSRDYEVDDHLADVSKAKKILNWEYKTKVIPWLEDYLKKNL